MAEHLKLPQTPSPVARSGAGDISEKELSRERHNLYSTPTARVQPAHPKKQLFSAPVNKFTAKTAAPSPNLERIKSCLDQYKRQIKAAQIGPKAASMEDLTPIKRVRRDRRDDGLPVVRSPGMHSADEELAAARIGKFMLVSAWRRRREEIRYVRKTLEFQVSCSERLRLQVSALKSLLESDSGKVRLAIRELERLKALLRDKDAEKAVLEREKQALERDVCAAEDRASEMSIGWRNCRNELESTHAALTSERVAAADARSQRDRAHRQVAILKEKVKQQEKAAQDFVDQVTSLRNELGERQRQLVEMSGQLAAERQARCRCERECAALTTSVAEATRERAALAELLAELRHQLAELRAELRDTREQLALWPRPLTRMLGAARSWLQRPMSLSDAVLWSLIPSRHGC